MSNGSELKSPAAQALRAAGFVPLPRLWVTEDQLDAVIRMAKGNAGTVNSIRAAADTRHKKTTGVKNDNQ